MIDLQTASAIGRDAAQALFLLSLAGALAGLLRWPRAEHKDFLLAFVVFLLGTAVTQIPVHLGGMVGWGIELVLVSAAGHLTQLAGAVLFLRAALDGVCAWWGWVVVVAAVAIVTAVV